jgi:hypothetical protein
VKEAVIVSTARTPDFGFSRQQKTKVHTML